MVEKQAMAVVILLVIVTAVVEAAIVAVVETIDGKYQTFPVRIAILWVIFVSLIQVNVTFY